MENRTGAQLERDQIVPGIVKALEPLDYVYAVWEGGAISFDRLDEMSDIDLYVDTQDGRDADVFSALEAALTHISPIKLKHEVPLPASNDYQHRFYRLENASEYLLVDVAVLKHSAKDKFLEVEIHGPAVFHFNKKGVVAIPALDTGKFLENLKVRLDKIENRVEMFRCFAFKELKRGNHIEAFDIYSRVMLEAVLELLRIKHVPLHYNFRTHHLLHDLPPDVVKTLRSLYFIKDERDLEKKIALADEWYRETLGSINLDMTARDLVKQKIK